MPDVVADAARSAHGAHPGSLSDVSATALGKTVLAGLADWSSLAVEAIDWGVFGMSVAGGSGIAV